MLRRLCRALNAARPQRLGRRFLGFSLLMGLAVAPSISSAMPQRNGAALDQLNLSKKGLALDGYDPVSYFPEGGMQAKRGKSDLIVSFRGVTYRFPSARNQAHFLADPERFEPDYGGWCAWAMAKDKKVEIDPESFLIEEGRLLVFFDGFFNDTRKSWKKQGGQSLRPSADRNWSKHNGKKFKVEKKKRSAKTKLGLGGKDPISLHSKTPPQAGSADISTRLGDTQYRFLNKDNRLKF